MPAAGCQDHSKAYYWQLFCRTAFFVWSFFVAPVFLLNQLHLEPQCCRKSFKQESTLRDHYPFFEPIICMEIKLALNSITFTWQRFSQLIGLLVPAPSKSKDFIGTSFLSIQCAPGWALNWIHNLPRLLLTSASLHCNLSFRWFAVKIHATKGHRVKINSYNLFIWPLLGQRL